MGTGAPISLTARGPNEGSCTVNVRLVLDVAHDSVHPVFWIHEQFPPAELCPPLRRRQRAFLLLGRLDGLHVEANRWYFWINSQQEQETTTTKATAELTERKNKCPSRLNYTTKRILGRSRAKMMSSAKAGDLQPRALTYRKTRRGYNICTMILSFIR